MINFKDENSILSSFYSGELGEEIEVLENNAKRVFTPQFVPFYPEVKQQHNLSWLETIIYGFINFYLTKASDRFYFTNSQLGKLFGVSDRQVSSSVSKLVDTGLLDITLKIKGNGGQMRYLRLSATTKKTSCRTRGKLRGNKNKINNNNTTSIETKVSGDINHLMSSFKKINPSYKILFANTTQRAALERMIKEHSLEKITKVIESLPETVTKPYAPKITTPLQLEQKLGELLIFISQERGKRRGGVFDARTK